MIEEAYDSYVHEVYMELYQTLTEGTQEIRLNNIGEAEVITNNGYIFHPYMQHLDGSIFFRGGMTARPSDTMSSVWFDAKDYSELAKLVRERILPDVVEKETKYKLNKLQEL